MLMMLVSCAGSKVKRWAADVHDARVLARSEVKGAGQLMLMMLVSGPVLR